MGNMSTKFDTGPVSLLANGISKSSRTGVADKHEFSAHLESAADQRMIGAVGSETKGDE